MKAGKRIAMKSDDPLNNRRSLISGSTSVKSATEDSVGVGQQAPTAVNATGHTNKLRLNHRIGTWNTRGLLQPGKLSVVEREINSHNISILGLCETHMKGDGYFQTSFGNVMYFSGHSTESKNGVGFIIPRRLTSFVSGYNPVNDRIMTIRLSCKPCPLNIVQIYAPTSLSSEEDINSFYGTLQETIDSISKRELLMVQGDWNAKVGSTSNEDHIRHIIGKYGMGIRNERGERFIDFCTSNDLNVSNTCFEHHVRRLYTWTSPGSKYRNQIDYITIAKRWRSSVTNVRTFPGADCGSDHQLLVADLRIRLKSTHKKKLRLMRVTGSDAKYFQNQVEAKLSQDTGNDSEISHLPESLWQNFCKTITTVIQKIDKKPQTKKEWISDETWKVITKRRQLKSCKHGVSEKEYSKLNSQIQKLCRRDKNRFFEKLCEEIESQSEKHQTADLFKTIKRVTRNFKPFSWIINDKDGNAIHDIAKAADRWREYCAELYRNEDHQFKVSPNPLLPYELEPDILMSEVENAINRLKINKAPGSDMITAEHLKALGPLGIAALHKICNVIWTTGEWPSDWVHSCILPIYKKGSVRNCGNYRTISLISHSSKILLYIINNRIRSFLDWQIPKEQAGFVRGKGTKEQILNVRQIVEKCYEYDTPVIMCFVDYQKAFDCVKWQQLWYVLNTVGVPQHLVSLIRNLYEKGYGTLKVGEITSERFPFEKGVRQGCIISPILFNIYGEYIMRKTLQDWEGGIKIGGIKISNLRYADDTTLFASSEGEMAHLLRRLELFSEELGLSINKSKTKLMIVDRFGSIQKTGKLNAYETVDQFSYLGSLINNRGDCEPEIRRRIGMAKTAMTQLQKIWKDRNISIKTKTKIVNTLVFPVFLYGCECWTIKAADRRRIDAFEMWCWRRMLRIPWTARRTNASILKEIHLDQRLRLSAVCLLRTLQYFGHIARRESDNLEKVLVTGRVEGKRRRGRNPMRWTDQVAATLKISVNAALHCAKDRNQWKHIISTSARRSHDPQQ